MHVHECTQVLVCAPVNVNVGVSFCVSVHRYVWFISAPRMRSQCPPSAPAFEVNARTPLGKCWQWEIKPLGCQDQCFANFYVKNSLS